MHQKLSFPKEFLFGSAVAAFQVENPDKERKADWDKFINENPKKHIIRPGEHGPDWWNLTRAKKDIDTMVRLGTRSLRLSLEWSRIEPHEGVYDPKAMLNYRELIDYAHERGLTPLVTINHFTLPQWIADSGSWTNFKTVEAYGKFVEYVLTFLHDIKYWITLNEPNGLVLSGYVTNYFPPQKGNIFAGLKARSHMIEAHKRAFKKLKSHDHETQVGIAYALIWYRPESASDLLERWYTYIIDYVNSTNYMVATMKYMDFIGCNYYTGYYLNLNPFKFRLTSRKDSAGIPETMLLGQTKRPGAYSTDMGWPIVPDFFLSLLRNLYSSYRKPILITENGIADDRDEYRAFYILTHLISMWKAMDEGIPILGYTYWSTIDNLEWLYGYTRHFGLIGYNAKTRVRRLHRSAGLYREIIDKHGIELTHILKTYIPEDQIEKAIILINKILTAGRRTPQIHYHEVPEKLAEEQKRFIV